LSEEKTETFICDMVIAKTISAKIDRIDGVVSFKKSKESNEILNSWSNDTGKLLSLVEKSVHFINKELIQKQQVSK
jgi:26S proteasome regulatory subunit N5